VGLTVLFCRPSLFASSCGGHGRWATERTYQVPTMWRELTSSN
jgi:hypothetical protein